MGNCFSTKGETRKKKLKLNIKSTGLTAIDELFRSAAAPLQTLHEVSSSVRKTKKSFKRITFTHVVIDSTLTDSIIGMIYCFSANTDGVLNSVEFELTEGPPYIGINKNKIPRDVVNIFEAWEALCDALYKAPGKLQELEPEIHSLVEESKDFPDRAETMCKTNNMGAMELLKALNIVRKNVNKIANAKRVIEETRAIILDLKKDIEGMTESFEKNKETIETVGKSAKKENLLHPMEIIPKFWPQQDKIDMTLNTPPKSQAQKK